MPPRYRTRGSGLHGVVDCIRIDGQCRGVVFRVQGFVRKGELMLDRLLGRPQAPYLDALASLPLLVDLTPRELGIFAGLVHHRHYQGDEIVFDQGEEGQALYFILSGDVLILRESGQEHPIARLGAGEFFGELALLDNSPRSAQARAACDCSVLALFRGDFLGLMQSHAQIASKIAMQLARHLGGRLRASVCGDGAV